MRKATHFTLTMIALIPCVVAVNAGYLVCLLLSLAHRIAPESTSGNCWTYVVPRWFRHGGYLMIRMADPPMTFIPHAVWLQSLPDGTEVEQTVPMKRARHWWQAWKTLYFPYRVIKRERSHDADLCAEARREH